MSGSDRVWTWVVMGSLLTGLTAAVGCQQSGTTKPAEKPVVRVVPAPETSGFVIKTWSDGRVMIGIKEGSGVQPGDFFLLKRDDRIVQTMQVTDVRQDVAYARVYAPETPLPQAGDRVILEPKLSGQMQSQKQ